jgi:hypothetical protein
MNEKIRTLYKNLFEVRCFPKPIEHHIEENTNKTIYGVYHILCVNNWYSLVAEQIESLKKSGLFNHTKTLYISAIISQQEDIEKIKDIVSNNEKLKFIYIGHNASSYEYPALEFIYSKANKEDFYVYYFHTKGISYQKETSKEYPSKDFLQLKRNTHAWRCMMEYFIFEHYNDAFKALQNYDAYGSYYRNPIVPPYHYRYFAGNFWWSKSCYIKTLPPITKAMRTNRFLAENWLLQKTLNIYSAFNTSAELYAIYIPECIYKKDMQCSLIELLRFYYSHYQFIAKRYLSKLH